MKNEKCFKNFEFLRVVGCLAIVFLHLFNVCGLKNLYPDIDLYANLHKMTSDGQKACELFFIISGFLFVYKLNTKKNVLEFIKGKLIRLWPVLLFVIFMLFIVSCFGVFEFNIYEMVLTVCGITGTSLFNTWGVVFVFWYVSALLFVLTGLYYLLRNYDVKHVNIVVALGVLFSYSAILQACNGHIWGKVDIVNNVINTGLLRAIGGVGIGYFIGMWWKGRQEQLVDNSFSFGTVLISLIEILCVYFIVNNLLFHKIKYNNDIIFVVVFVLTIVLFLLKKGFLTKVLEIDFWSKLSRYVYSIYMTHWCVYFVFQRTFWVHHKSFVYSHPLINVLMTLFLVVCLGVLTYHFVEKPSFKYLKKLN